MTGQRGLLRAVILAAVALTSQLVEAPELAAAERPAHVPVRRAGVSGPVLPEGAAKSPPAESLHQATYALQPETPQAPGPSTGPVPVETLVRHALVHNPEIQAARAHARSLRARIPQAASLPDPQFVTMVFLDSIETAAGPQQVAMSLAQKFPWFGKLGLRGQIAGHDAMAAYARLAAVELKVTEEVKRAYFDLYFLQRAIDVTRSLEPRLKDVVDISRTRFENAEVGLENVLKAQVELSRLKTRLIELEQAKAEAQARLAGVLHLPPSTRIDARADVDRVKLAHTAELLVQLAESHQPELDARRREISRDRSSVALACRDYWPDVTLSFNWYEIGSPGLSPVATGDDAYSLAVGVSVPLYRKRLDAAVREARYNTARSARQYAATLDQVRAEVQALYARFVQHDRVLEILEAEIVPRAEQTLELSIEAYRVGKLEFQQLIDAYEDLLKDRIETYRREALRRQVVASLERAVGRAVTALPIEAASDAASMAAPLPPQARHGR